MEEQKFDLFFEAKASKDEDRVIEYIASKEIVDDMGRIFKISGMDLSLFKKFKSVFWNHNTWDVPIGKGIAARKKGDEVRIKVKFAEESDYPFADTVYKLVRGGYINGGSVGISVDPNEIEYPENKKVGGKPVRMIVNKSTLREFSITPMPANVAAVPLDAALKDGVITDEEMVEFKAMIEKEKPEDKNIDEKDPTDEIIELKAKILELELQIKDQEIEEETADSIYEQLYDEFTVSEDKDEEDDEDSLLDEYLT